MKALILAGGTGGHIFPALAIAKELQAKGYDIDWVGTKAGLEAEIVPKNNIKLHYVTVTGLRGKNKLTLALAPFRLLNALFQSIKLILKLKPNVVIGMGGFVTGPTGLAAILLRKPLILHEQNSVAGTTNRLLAKFAKKFFVSFPDVKRLQKLDNIVYTGNPIRKEFINLPTPLKTNKIKPLKILVLGGSRGALFLNNLTFNILNNWQGDHKPEVWHQAGAQNYDAIKAKYDSANIEVKVTAFIDNMLDAYLYADLIICRAGAMTVAEITAVGVASILVPLPHAIDNHQYYNAKFLSDNNAGILMEQKQITADNIIAKIKYLTENRADLVQMASNARALAKPNATADIISMLG